MQSLKGTYIFWGKAAERAMRREKLRGLLRTSVDEETGLERNALLLRDQSLAAPSQNTTALLRTLKQANVAQEHSRQDTLGSPM